MIDMYKDRELVDEILDDIRRILMRVGSPKFHQTITSLRLDALYIHLRSLPQLHFQLAKTSPDTETRQIFLAFWHRFSCSNVFSTTGKKDQFDVQVEHM
ncbi:hypothetical protein E2P81_ATG00676 [Venturia nashicola]|nr:hypothetical protein E2P81_ATG00676 [Venturia nashicola]